MAIIIVLPCDVTQGMNYSENSIRSLLEAYNKKAEGYDKKLKSAKEAKKISINKDRIKELSKLIGAVNLNIGTLRKIQMKYPQTSERIETILNQTSKRIKYYISQLQEPRPTDLVINQQVGAESSIEEKYTTQAGVIEERITTSKVKLEETKKLIKEQSNYENGLEHLAKHTKLQISFLNSYITDIKIYVEDNPRKLDKHQIKDFSKAISTYEAAVNSFKSCKRMSKYGQFSDDIKALKTKIAYLESNFNALKDALKSPSSSESDREKLLIRCSSVAEQLTNDFNNTFGDKNKIILNQDIIKKSTEKIVKLSYEFSQLKQNIELSALGVKKSKLNFQEVIGIIAQAALFIGMVAGMLI